MLAAVADVSWVLCVAPRSTWNRDPCLRSVTACKKEKRWRLSHEATIETYFRLLTSFVGYDAIQNANGRVQQNLLASCSFSFFLRLSLFLFGVLSTV